MTMVFRFICATAMFCASTALADPPRVKSAQPDDGDSEVNPSLKEIRIEFDQPMSRSGYSVCGGGPAFPELTGKVRWLSDRVLVIPVKLKPDHDYQFSINCPAAQNCRGANGEPAEPYPIAFHTRSGKETKKSKANVEENLKAVAALRKAIDESYSYRDLHKLDWKKLIDESSKKLERAAGPAEFARETARMLRAAKDIHITVRADGRMFATHRRAVPANCNLKYLAEAVPQWKQHNDCVWSGRFEDGIGYILIATWGPRDASMLDAVDEAIDSFGEAKGIVIDVRPNSGGDELLARKVAGRFIDKPRVYSKSVFRRKGTVDGFTKPVDRIIEPRSDKPRFAGKTAVLMGAHNMSSCESFIYMMKQNPQSRLFGEKTYGSSGNPRPHDLGNGVTVLLPSWKDLGPDGSLLEGRGIMPDEVVKVAPKAFETSDPVLEKAMEWLRG